MTSGHVPRYRAIAEDLTQKIRSGRYRAGDALPPQRELSAEYGVTLMTLRQALQLLSAEGLVVQQPGRGTYVAPPHAAYRLDSLDSLGDELHTQGYPVRTEVLSTAIRPLPGRLTEPMGAARSHKALRLARVRHLAGQPAIHQVSWIPEPLGSAIKGSDFRETSLYTALAHAGVVVCRASERIRPALLIPSIAARLKRSPGGPVFVSERITYDARDLVVVFDEAIIVGEYMEIRAERAADISLEWVSTLSR
jgi:GntR family transcriptional regulator